MIKLRVAGEADLAVDADRLGLGGDAGELDAVGGLEKLDAIEPGVEIEMPPRTAQLAVGRELQSDLFLFLHQTLDLAVLDRRELGGRDRAGRPLGARLLDGRGSQQAADVIGAERGLGACHGVDTFLTTDA